MSEIVFLLEEASAEAMLPGLLPRLLPEGTTIRYIVFDGKQDLEKQMVRRLRGYRVPEARFVVLRDQDSADCHVIKNRLLEMCPRQAGRTPWCASPATNSKAGIWPIWPPSNAVWN